MVEDISSVWWRALITNAKLTLNKCGTLHTMLCCVYCKHDIYLHRVLATISEYMSICTKLQLNTYCNPVGWSIQTLYATNCIRFCVFYIYTIVWFLRAPRWYIGPTAMPRANVTLLAVTAARGITGWTISSVAPEHNHAFIIITTWSHDVSSFHKLFACGSLPWGALIQSQILFVSHDRVNRSALACARTWERTPPNNGHHVMRSSNEREAFLIALATTVTPISPWGRYWECTFLGKYALQRPQ